MLNYFLKNRRGVVSVFMAIILIAIISLSSLLVELGRKRSIDSMFQQMVETSAFSTLSNYDRELYKRFTLMALSPNVDENTLEKYMNACLNTGVSDSKIIDQEIALEDLSFQGLYDLANPNVLRNQIEENWKYRGPYNIVDGTLNLEASLTDFVKSLEKSVPALEFFKTAATSFQKVTEVMEKAVALSVATQSMLDAKDTYESGVDTYNSAVEDYEDNINSLSTDDEDYAEKKAEYDSEIESAAEIFKGHIQGYIDAANGFVESIDEFGNTYAELLGMGVDITLQQLAKEEYDKVMQKNTGPYKDWTEDEKKNYKEALDKMANPGDTDEVANILQDIKDYLEDVKKDKFENMTKELGEQKESIKGSDWPKVDIIKLKIGFIAGITLLIDYALFVLETCAKLIELVKKLWETLKMIIDICKCISSALLFMGPDLRYNDSISAIKDDLPSENTSVGNSYSATVSADQSYVTEQLERTKEVSEKLGYNTDYINPAIDNSSLALSDKLDNLGVKGNAIINNCMDMVSYLTNFQILKFIQSVSDTLWSVVEFLIATLEVADAFIAQFFGESSLLKVMYRKLMIVDYAAMMFPNRTTNYSSDSDGLGNDWKDRGDGWSQSNDLAISVVSDDNFSLARAEYIFAGNSSELTNQTIVYGVMYGLRSLSNIFPTVTNKIILDLVKTAPPFGAIAAIIVGFIFLLLETIVDMILICYGGVKLPLVKIDLWCFTAEGAQKLADKLKEMSSFVGDKLKNALKKDVAGDKDGTKGKKYVEESADDFIDGLEIGYWGYTDYLRLMFTFCSEKKLLLRMSDLIQLEMSNATGSEYKMNEAFTYLRITAKGKYNPIMPIPLISGVNSKDLTINKLYYIGY